MNTPAQCGAIKPPKPDIYSEAPHWAHTFTTALQQIRNLPQHI